MGGDAGEGIDNYTGRWPIDIFGGNGERGTSMSQSGGHRRQNLGIHHR